MTQHQMNFGLQPGKNLAAPVELVFGFLEHHQTKHVWQLEVGQVGVEVCEVQGRPWCGACCTGVSTHLESPRQNNACSNAWWIPSWSGRLFLMLTGRFNLTLLPINISIREGNVLLMGVVRRHSRAIWGSIRDFVLRAMFSWWPSPCSQ